MLLKPGVESLTAELEPPPLPGADPRYILGHAPAGNGNHFNTEPDRSPVRHVDPIVRDGNRRYLTDGRLGLSLAGLVGVLLLCSGFYAWWNRAPRAAGSAQVSPSQAPLVAAVSQSKSEQPATPSLNVTSSTGPDGENHVVLNLSATEKTWISITSDGKQIFSGILQPSQTKTLTGTDVARLRIGNAGGLEIQWNGKTIGPVGPRGQVRVVVFTPENFQVLPGSPTL
jgi:hypothetical protein